MATFWIAAEDKRMIYRPIGIDAETRQDAIDKFLAKYPQREYIRSVRTVDDYDNGLSDAPMKMPARITR